MSPEMYIAVAALSVAAVAFLIGTVNGCMNVGSLFSLGRRADWNKGSDYCRLDAFRYFLGMKLFTGGYGKHKAYHVASDGRVLAVDAVDFYLALFSGMDDFWEIVACAEGEDYGANLVAGGVGEPCLGDGERAYTRIHYRGGETYIDGRLPSFYEAYPDFCARTTAEEFEREIVEAQKRANEGACGGDVFQG